MVETNAQENFPLLMAALLLLLALSQTTWPKPVTESDDFVSIVSHLLNLLPKTKEQVMSVDIEYDLPCGGGLPPTLSLQKC